MEMEVTTSMVKRRPATSDAPVTMLRSAETKEEPAFIQVSFNSFCDFW